MMMSFERKRPNHVKLPSFNELTATFNMSMKINGSREDDSSFVQSSTSTTIPSSAHPSKTTSHHPHSSAAAPQQNLQHPLEPPPPPPSHRHFVSHSQPITPISSQHPTQQLFHHDQQQRYHNPQAPIQPPPEALSFRFPPQQSQLSSAGPSGPQVSIFQPSDPNYVISSTHNPQPPHPYLPQHQYQQSSQVATDRRLSLQIPHTHDRRLSLQTGSITSSGHHVKSDSIESQASLQHLADIASYSPTNNGLHRLLHEFEGTFSNFEDLFRNVSDMKTDFLDHLSLSATSKNEIDGEEQAVGTRLPLNLEYSTQDGTINEFKAEYFEKLIDNIPPQTINDSVRMLNELNDFFQHLLIQKDRDVRRLQRHRRQESTSSRKREMSVSPPPTFRTPTFRTPTFRTSTSSIHSQQEHHHAIPQVIGAPNKKRKPSKASNTLNKSDSISLIVKPPKPQTEPTANQPLKGQFQEELSLKQDHKCHQCGSDDTPEWRRGPYGSRSLCNACGLFYGKLIKKFGAKEAADIMVGRRDSGNGDDRRIPTDLD